ncbi:MAG: VWA domain-containing protein, partial [Planctomycetaceae bacterium]|nr:VWA domain-containing protein [Planctomycetaceae bacterium]
RLQDLLLLAVRMGLLALLVFGMARPWAKGGPFSVFSPVDARDIAIVLDGSYSMGWEGTGVTPRSVAIQRAHELLDRCRAGDTVTLIDAHEQPLTIPPAATTDIAQVRQALDALPPATGTSRLASAVADAVQSLAFTTNATRHVVVLTDRQALPWLPLEDAAWTRLAELQRSLPLAPRVYLLDVTNGADAPRDNVAVGPLDLSRDLTVPGFPLRVRTTLQQSGDAPLERRVTVEINGQRLDDKAQSVAIPPHGRTPVEFEHRFAATGSYVIAVTVEPDDLPGDDSSAAAIVVDRGLPVLLIDGDPQADPVKSETYFLKAAFSPADNQTPWVAAESIDWRQWTPADLQNRVAVFLCNVPQFSDEQIAALRQYVADGGGLIIAPGDRAAPDAYTSLSAAGLLPLPLAEPRREQDYTLRPILIDPQSLETGWLSRFRTETGVDLAQTRFASWWGLDGTKPEPAAAAQPTQSNRETTAGAPTVDARLKTLDPLIVSSSLGRGAIVELAVPLDADWCTLPTRNDFVPFVHELVFALVSRETDRNVPVGSRLRVPLGENERARDWTFLGPDGAKTPGRGTGEISRVAELPSAALAGVYEAEYQPDPRRREYFVALADRAESNLAPLDPQQIELLKTSHGVQLVGDLDAYAQATRAEPAPVELWRWLLLAALAALVLETIITRSMVRRGHMDVEEAFAEAA